MGEGLATFSSDSARSQVLLPDGGRDLVQLINAMGWEEIR